MTTSEILNPVTIVIQDQIIRSPGSQGTQGIQGFNGIQGSQGIQGTQGLDGLYAGQGAQGPQGTDGIQGFDGAFAAQGIQGIQGAQGLQGIRGFQGSGGVDGLQGIQGTQGIQAAQGIQGTTGAQGIQGITGSQGVQGITGAQGVQGIQAAQGITGSQGVQGIQGITGVQGIQGITGSGSQGIQGIQGPSGSGGSVTTNYIPKGSSGSLVNSTIFDNGTSVGVGTATPSSTYKLDVAGQVRLSQNVHITNDSADTWRVRWARSDDTQVTGIKSDGYQKIMFVSNNNERLRIDGSGNTGIGTSTPTYKLDVNGSANTANLSVGGVRVIEKINGTNVIGLPNPVNGILQSAGKKLFLDDEFTYSNNDINIYNNRGFTGGTAETGVVHTRKNSSFAVFGDITTTSNWQSGACTLTAGAIAPDGNTSAYTMEAIAPYAQTTNKRSTAWVVPASASITFSIFVKFISGSTQTFSIVSEEVGFIQCTATFNLATGVVSSTGGGATGAITSIGDSWYRISMTYTNSDTVAKEIYPRYWIGTYTGDSFAGAKFYLWNPVADYATTPSTYPSTYQTSASPVPNSSGYALEIVHDNGAVVFMPRDISSAPTVTVATNTGSLPASTTYLVKLIAWVSGSRRQSPHATVTTTTTDKQLNVSWSAVSGATQYEVWFSKDSGVIWQRFASISSSTTSYNISAESGTGYDSSNRTIPGYGGWAWAFTTSNKVGKELIFRFKAKIPSGLYLGFASNEIGTDQSRGWLTNNVGTGKYEDYAYYINVGTYGTLATTGYFYLTNSTGTTAPLTPISQFSSYLASATVYDVTNLSTSATMQLESVAANTTSLVVGGSLSQIPNSSITANKLYYGSLTAGNYYATIEAIDIVGNPTGIQGYTTSTTISSTDVTNNLRSINYSWPTLSGAVSYRLWINDGSTQRYFATSNTNYTVTSSTSGGTVGTATTTNKTGSMHIRNGLLIGSSKDIGAAGSLLTSTGNGLAWTAPSTLKVAAGNGYYDDPYYYGSFGDWGNIQFNKGAHQLSAKSWFNLIEATNSSNYYGVEKVIRIGETQHRWCDFYVLQNDMISLYSNKQYNTNSENGLITNAGYYYDYYFAGYVYQRANIPSISYKQKYGDHIWHTDASAVGGNAGAGITYNEAMKLSNNGDLLLNNTIHPNYWNSNVHQVLKLGYSSLFTYKDAAQYFNDNGYAPITALTTGAYYDKDYTYSDDYYAVGPGSWRYFDPAGESGGVSNSATTALCYQQELNQGHVWYNSSNVYPADGGFISWTEVMRIDNNGSVGIGTSAPSQKLHVIGNAIFNGSINVTGLVDSSYGMKPIKTTAALGGNLGDGLRFSATTRPQVADFTIPSSVYWYGTYVIDGEANGVMSGSAPTFLSYLDGHMVTIRILSDGTARAITFKPSGYGTFRALSGVTLPTTTVVGKTIYMRAIYNHADYVWDVLSVQQNA